jgi:hypothetical protein
VTDIDNRIIGFCSTGTGIWNLSKYLVGAQNVEMSEFLLACISPYELVSTDCLLWELCDFSALDIPPVEQPYPKPHGFTHQNKPKNIQIGQVLREIYSK